jgi:hypothetical protein
MSLTLTGQHHLTLDIVASSMHINLFQNYSQFQVINVSNLHYLFFNASQNLFEFAFNCIDIVLINRMIALRALVLHLYRTTISTYTYCETNFLTIHNLLNIMGN